MARESFMICDACRERVEVGRAKGWISVSSAHGSSFSFSGNYFKPELFGLYCSCSCLKKRIAEIDDFEANPPMVTGIEVGG